MGEFFARKYENAAVLPKSSTKGYITHQNTVYFQSLPTLDKKMEKGIIIHRLGPSGHLPVSM